MRRDSAEGDARLEAPRGAALDVGARLDAGGGWHATGFNGAEYGDSSGFNRGIQSRDSIAGFSGIQCAEWVD